MRAVAFALFRSATRFNALGRKPCKTERGAPISARPEQLNVIFPKKTGFERLIQPFKNPENAYILPKLKRLGFPAGSFRFLYVGGKLRTVGR